jgi:nucleoid-associated protein YgaU
MRKALTTAAAVGGLAAVTLATATTATAATASDAQWDTLAQCESGGNWGINTGNGFHGGLQFTQSTWIAYGGGSFAPSAEKASRAEQISVAQKVAASQGFGAWPSCSRKAGLFGFASGTDQAASRSATRKPLSTTSATKGGSVGKGRHVVRSGETLSTIARQNHVSGGWESLFAANRTVLKSPNVLNVGQVITIA